MDETFGTRVKELRKARKLTLEELADKVGSTKSYMWELENKRNANPSAWIVHKLARALDVTFDQLFLGEEEADAGERILLREYRSLNDGNKQLIGKIAVLLKEIQDKYGR